MIPRRVRRRAPGALLALLAACTQPHAPPPPAPQVVVAPPGPAVAPLPFVAAGSPRADGPLVLGLHGLGDDAERFSQLAGLLAPDLAWHVLRAPLPAGQGAMWFPRQPAAAMTRDLRAAMDRLGATIQTAAPRPVVLLGFSQGCMLAAQYLAAHPDAVRAVVCIGGALKLPVASQPPGPRAPILFVHGEADTMVPLQAAQQAVDTLKAQGFAVDLLRHPGGHRVPPEHAAAINAWLHDKLARP